MIETIFWSVLWTLSTAWILYRLLVDKQFLLWDWKDGKVRYVWETWDDSST